MRLGNPLKLLLSLLFGCFDGAELSATVGNNVDETEFHDAAQYLGHHFDGARFQFGGYAWIRRRYVLHHLILEDIGPIHGRGLVLRLARVNQRLPLFTLATEKLIPQRENIRVIIRGYS